MNLISSLRGMWRRHDEKLALRTYADDERRRKRAARAESEGGSDQLRAEEAMIDAEIDASFRGPLSGR
jgi:hypothetical protein